MPKRAHLDTRDAIDITRSLGMNTPVFPGDPKIIFEKMDSGCGSSITKITISSHSGTHMDAPSHYIKNGGDVRSVPLELINGMAHVIDLTGIERTIHPGDLTIKDEKIILIKTGYSQNKNFEQDFYAISIECAEYLVNSGIKCIGIDTPSIEPLEGDGSVHRALLSAKVAIIEMLDLSCTGEGVYIMNALPLPLENCDGAPIRALLYRVKDGVKE